MKKKILITLLIIIVIIIISFVILLNTKNTQWKITQYGDNIGAQMMCYVVEGNKNGLIIVDGGYKENNEQFEFIKNKIAENNNIVDAWIITHFDSDHGGVALRTIKEMEDIKIKKIFIQDINESMGTLKENAPYEDDWSTYEEFVKLELPQKIKVHSGDYYENVIVSELQ